MIEMFSAYRLLLNESASWYDGVRTDQGKSWNLQFKFSRSGKSWKIKRTVVTISTRTCVHRSDLVTARLTVYSVDL